MRRVLFIGALFCSLEARAQGLGFDEGNKLANEVDSEIQTMQRDLDVVEKGYGTPITAEVTKVDRRLREAEIHFLLSDYLRASIVLLDVVEDEENKGHPRYDDCVFLLAESLRKSRNFIGSKRAYEEALDRAGGDRLKDVVLGLLDIANETNRYEDVERYIGRLRQAGTLSRPDVDYIYGKMLFRSAGNDPTQIQRALDVFRGIPTGTSVSGPASYYAGVTLVRLGRYEDAIAQFQDTLAKAKGNNTLTELATLSLGRLYQELGQVDKSTAAYQSIGQGSPYFSDMLYEVAWAHVTSANKETETEAQKKQFLRALQALEILMATSPSSRLFPEARILQGNLQIRLGAPETAYDTFQTIVDRYGGARDRLAELRTTGDPKEFFNSLMERDLDAVMATSILPPLAVTWALEEQDMGRAVAMQTDLRTSSKYMTEARELVQILEDALLGEQKYRMIPGLSKARAKALSIENRIIAVGDRLRSIERRALYDHLSESERSRITQIAARADEIHKEIEALPMTDLEVETNREKIKEEYLETSRRAYRLTYRVSTMRAQLVAVEIWLGRNREHMPPEEVALTEERIKESTAEVQRLEKEMDALQTELRRATLIAESDAGRTRAMRMQEELDRVIAEEVSMLRGRRSASPGEFQGLFLRLDQQRATLGEISANLARLQTQLDAQVRDRVAEIQREVAVEVNKLAEYETEHGTLAGETELLLGPIATRTLDAVGEQFRSLVLRADVGIIDVAWARKQAETDKVNTLIKEQRDRTQELEEEFSDVLKD
jgi:tetratricopeptide (TPR) repeat protein